MAISILKMFFKLFPNETVRWLVILDIKVIKFKHYFFGYVQNLIYKYIVATYMQKRCNTAMPIRTGRYIDVTQTSI